MEDMGGGKMMDVGMKRKDMVDMPETDKNKIVYPSVRIEKDMGMKMGQKVMMEGMVTGMQKGENGESTTIEVRKCEKGETMKEDHPQKKLVKQGSKSRLE